MTVWKSSEFSDLKNGINMMLFNHSFILKEKQPCPLLYVINEAPNCVEFKSTHVYSMLGLSTSAIATSSTKFSELSHIITFKLSEVN